MSLSVDHISYSGRASVIPGGDPDSAPPAGGVDDLTIADVHGHMVNGSAAVSVEDQVSWPHLAGVDGPPYLCLLPGGSWKVDVASRVLPAPVPGT